MPKDMNEWNTDDFLTNEFDDMQLEDFTLEDVLAEFGSGRKNEPLQNLTLEDIDALGEIALTEKDTEEKIESVKKEVKLAEEKPHPMETQPKFVKPQPHPIKTEQAKAKQTKKVTVSAKSVKDSESSSRNAMHLQDQSGESTEKKAIKQELFPKNEHKSMPDVSLKTVKNTENVKKIPATENAAKKIVEKPPEEQKIPPKREPKAAHAVSAERKVVRQPRNLRLDETVRLNELFENKEDYDKPAKEKESEPSELPSAYVKRNALRVRNMAMRSVFAFLLCLPACYLSFASMWKWPVPSFIAWNVHPFRFLIALSLLHLLAIVLHMDIISAGLKKLVTLHADLFSMIAVSSIASLMHAVYMMIVREARQSMSFSAVGIVLLFFAGYGMYLRESARLRACKAASSKEPLGVFISERDQEINLIKHPVKETESFTKYVQMEDGAERFWSYLAPILLIAALVFATISSVGRGEASRFFWAFAAITSVATPFFLLLCYPLPFAKITKRLSHIGAALAGWYAAFSLSGERNLIIRDSDIFPKGSVTLHGLKVFGNHSLEKTVSYATSIIHEAKSGLEPVFGELLKSQYGKCEHVYHLLHHESGGMEADVCGDHVLLGTAAFILRMGIRIPQQSVLKNAMFLTINGSLAAVFNLNYKVSRDVRVSLESTIRSKVKPVMAVIDCNQNPVMLESELHVRSGSIEYPPVEERLDLASEEQFLEYDPCALITRAGLGPFASAVLTARRLRKVTIRNVILSTVCALIGMLLMFYITFVGSYESAAAYNVFLYQLLWTLPVYLLSIRSGAN